MIIMPRNMFACPYVILMCFLMNKIILLQIRESGDDYTVYACKTHEIAHRIIREWFEDRVDNINDYDIDDLEDEMWERDIGYWEITEQVVICE